jgi:DedD protein
MSDDGYREIQLTGKQLVFLFMTATVVAVVIFLLGVLVGRGVRAEKDAASAASLLSAPQIVPDVVPAAAAETPAPATQGAGGATPAPRPVDEPAPDRREPPVPAGESIKPDAPAARPSQAPAAAKKEPAPGGADPAARPVAPARDPAADAPTEALTIQVAAVAKRTEADAIVKRLIGKGYKAYVAAPSAKSGGMIFRVCVGSFKSRKDAEETAHRLEKEGHKPWIR